MNEFSTAPSITSAPFNRPTRANSKDKDNDSTKQAGEGKLNTYDIILGFEIGVYLILRIYKTV